MTPDTAGGAHDGAEILEGRTEAGLLRVFTRVAHGEHLHAPSFPIGTRRRPVAASGALVHRTRGTTARKVIWS